MSFYNSAQPTNIKQKYGEFDVITFLMKMPTGRQCKAGSMRVNGYLKLYKTSPAGVSSAIDGTEGIMLDQFAGVHSFFRNTNSTINNRTVESLQNYPRYVSMVTQHDFAPESLISNSLNAPELKGALNTHLLNGDNINKGIAFSMKPQICVNKSSADLAQSKFQEIQVMFQLGSSIEALYISGAVNPDISSLSYEFTDLQLSWMETMEVPNNEPVVLNTVSNMIQTVTGISNNLTLVSSVAYDALSMSFMHQSSVKSLYNNNMLCEYIPDISRVEFLVNGVDAPLSYAITTPAYQDIALNYYKSLSSSGNAIWGLPRGEKNSIMNRFYSENGCFGIGSAFASSINDKLQVALTIDDNTKYNPSSNPIDCFIYTNGYISL
jgi:hypothetical protein